MFVTFKTIDGHTIQSADYPLIEKIEIVDQRIKSFKKSNRYWKLQYCFIPWNNWLTIFIVDRNIKANKP
jgi:hypothetical protein